MNFELIVLGKVEFKYSLVRTLSYVEKWIFINYLSVSKSIILVSNLPGNLRQFELSFPSHTRSDFVQIYSLFIVCSKWLVESSTPVLVIRASAMCLLCPFS